MTMTTVHHPVRLSAWLTLCATALLGVGQAQAHAKLVTAEPAANAAVAAPKMILLQFDEELARKLSSIKLTDADGHAVSIMSMEAKDAKSLVIMANSSLVPGVYTVSWIAVATDDGHKTTGSYSFTVK
jgi:methionine-rich copper-binding protein CopC